MHIHHREPSIGIFLRKFDQERSLILVNRIDSHHFLHHPIRNLRQILRFDRPVLIVAHTSFSGKTVQRRKIQRCDILDNEIPSSIRIHALELIIHAIGVTHEISTGHLAVGEKSTHTEIIGADSDAVDGGVRGIDHEFLSCFRLVVLRVLDVRGDFVLFHSGEIAVDGAQIPRRDVVAAHGTLHGVVVEVGARVLFDVFGPDAAAVGGSVVLRKHNERDTYEI